MKKSKIFLLICLVSIFLFIPKTYALTPSVRAVQFRYGTRALNGTGQSFSSFMNLPKMNWSNVDYPFMIQPNFEIYTNSTNANITNFDEFNQYYVYMSLPGSWKDSNLTCNNINLELIFYNENTETFDYFNSSISCVNMKYRKNFYNQDGYSYNAYNIILQLNVPGNFADSYKIGRITVTSKAAAFIDDSPYQIGLSYFAFDTEYKESFLNISNELMEKQMEQNLTIINQNNQTNAKLDEVKDKIKDTNDTIKSDNVSGANTTAKSFFDNFTTTNHGGISSIVSAPLTAVNAMLNGTCTPLTATYKNKTIEFPCGNDFWDKMSEVKTFLNVVEGGILCYCIIISLYKDIEKLKNPDDDRVDVMDL